MPKKNLATYRRIARKASKIWLEHGALDYHECAGDDLDVKFGLPFPRGIKTQPGEPVVFVHIVYQSRKDRNRVNPKVIADPRLTEQCDPKKMPFDCRRIPTAESIPRRSRTRTR